ncbi:hypothetical protein CK203_084759 [Vitis vinifera]|uniref:Mitochondrial import inner membrane translocase subunit TIM50 n=1 Tax=Vitis vinifera TaxID=29760 RepID=A0A438EKB9_VITVI|nr:hypothetical protein CK203_084759 [Vitis vinifera]
MYQLGEDDESSQDECTLTEVSTRKQAQLPKHESWNTISCLIARVTSFFINTNSHSFMAVPSLFIPISPNMSGKLDISKNKNVVPTESESESESENEKDSGNDFGPFKGYTPRIPKHRRPDVVFGKHLVYSRPHSEDFMKFCLERFEVGIWSSSIERNLNAALDCAIGGLRGKLLFAWDQVYCTDTGFKSLEKKTKPLFLKELRKIWESSDLGKRFSSSNTLLIDDSPYKAILNPFFNTGIFPASYNADNVNDTELGPRGALRLYLDGLVDAVDVASYVKEHPFGQPAISPTHSHWDFYSVVIQRFRNSQASKSNVPKK